MPPLVIFLYYLCFGLLLFLGSYILARKPHLWLHRYFSLAVLCLFGWLLTLYLFDLAQAPEKLLWLGRLNFAAVAFAVLFAYLFMAELTRYRVRNSRALLAETTLLGLITLFTPLVDRKELFAGGAHLTLFGSLFPIYLTHVVLFLAGALYCGFTAVPNSSAYLRAQLLVVGIGMAATGLVASVTNLVLPYVFHNFAYVDVGALSTILVLGAIAYAISVYRLFDLKVIIRKTVLFGLLLTTVHGLYSTLVFVLTQWLPSDRGLERYRFELQVLGILAVALGLDPLKQFLEEKLEQMLPTQYRRGRARKPGS